MLNCPSDEVRQQVIQNPEVAVPEPETDKPSLVGAPDDNMEACKEAMPEPSQVESNQQDQ
jgi:hypothetical protein